MNAFVAQEGVEVQKIRVFGWSHGGNGDIVSGDSATER